MFCRLDYLLVALSDATVTLMSAQSTKVNMSDKPLPVIVCGMTRNQHGSLRSESFSLKVT